MKLSPEYEEILSREYPELSPAEAGRQRLREMDAAYASKLGVTARNLFRIAAICALVSIVLAIIATIVGATSEASGQLPLQPGDTPAPVVDGPDVFEVGLLAASIKSPPAVEACTFLVLDISGSSDGKRRLEFRPKVPDVVMQYDTGGDLLYVVISKPGSYAIIWSVENDEGKAWHGAGVVVTPRGEPPPDDPGDPTPPRDPKDAAFLKYVKELTAKVEAENHAEISADFLGIADRIGNYNPDGKFVSGDLGASGAIEAATVEALFSKKGKVNPEWRDWWLKLWPYMLNSRHNMAPANWAKDYRLVAEEVGR